MATLTVVLAIARPLRMIEASAPDGIVSRTVETTGKAPEGVPFFSRNWVTPAEHTPSVHGSTICTLASGDLMTVWYGGSREGAADVSVFTSRLKPGTTEWSVPTKAVDRAMAESELDRQIKKVGNAVVFPDGSGRLCMVYVSVSVGGWSGSALNIKTSEDEGRTWGESSRLTLNPFLNISTLVRNEPIYASDGRIGLPVYHEMAMKFPQMLWLTPDTKGGFSDYRIRNLTKETSLLQPTLVPLQGGRILMLLRDHRGSHCVYTSYSSDNGWTWSEAVPSNLPNPNSAVDAVCLRDGRILMAYNHSVDGRGNLRLAVSSDEGRTWKTCAALEEGINQEFSYPNLAEDKDGRIHVTYTWKRKRIRHVAFNMAWLDQSNLAPRFAVQP